MGWDEVLDPRDTVSVELGQNWERRHTADRCMHPMRDPRQRTTRFEGSTGPDTTDGREGVEPPDDAGKQGVTSRRHLLFVSGGLLVGSALTTPAGAADSNHYELGALTSHWGGEEPSEIEGEENPTLTLTPGEEYTVTWHNRDGNYHKLLIRDEDRNVLENTDGNGEEGSTESVTFVATDEMHDYQCEPHFSMNGDIETQGGSPAADETETQTQTETRTETPTQTETDTETPTDDETATATGTPTDAASETTSETAVETPAETATDTPSETRSGETATEAETATQTTGENATGTATPEVGPDDDPDDQSVFGFGSVLTGAGGVVYLLRRRFADADE